MQGFSQETLNVHMIGWKHFVDLLFKRFNLTKWLFCFFLLRSHFVSERRDAHSTSLWDLLLLRGGLARQEAQGEKAHHCPGLEMKSVNWFTLVQRFYLVDYGVQGCATSLNQVVGNDSVLYSQHSTAITRRTSVMSDILLYSAVYQISN